MSALPFLDEAALRAALPGTAAVDALERAFTSGGWQAPPRAHHAVPGGDLLLMPAASADGVGVKVVTVAPANPARGLPLISGLYLLLDAETLRPAALVDGAAVTNVRTAAVSALATRHLARSDAAHLVVLGAGAQARSHVEALARVRPVERVTVVSRTASSAEELAEVARSAGLAASVGTAEALRDADVVAACTTSATPVVAGADLAPGTHVVAVGAYRPDARELDTEVLRRGRVVVEDRDAALAEAGDLCIPVAAGEWSGELIAADLAEVCRGMQVRTAPEDITVFKSVGMAMEDLAVVAAALDGRW
jgi:ornithine cyclodeaminase/alanine dehydrogenase-like protein (mu-crystallin family)